MALIYMFILQHIENLLDALEYSKTCVKRPIKKDKTKILMTNGSLMQVESIAECSPWSILQHF